MKIYLTFCIALIAICVSTVGFSQPAQAAQLTNRTCIPTQVAVRATRIAVQCKPINGQGYTKDIIYYAMAYKDRSPQVELTLQVLLTAQANNRPLRIRIDLSDHESVPGCQGNNCRRLASAAMR